MAVVDEIDRGRWFTPRRVGGFVCLCPPCSKSFLAVRPSTRVLFGDALQFVRSSRHGLSTVLAWTPLMGFIDAPPPVTAAASTPGQPDIPCGTSVLPSDRALPGSISFRSCRSSRLQRFPPQQIPSRRSVAARRFVAPCSRPGGSPCFQRVGGLAAPLDLAVAHGPKIVPRLSRWRRPFEAFPSPVASSSSPQSFRRRTAFTEESCLLVVGLGASFEPSPGFAPPCGPRPPFPRRRPQGFAPPESPLRPRDVAVRDARCSHGLWMRARSASIRAGQRLPGGLLGARRRTGHPMPIVLAIHVKERVSLTEVVETVPSR